jgi:UDP-N-acetylmuramoylalanine--D-glutamate ligase
VTGSDGKTTTTTLISEMLKAAGYTVWLGGNIGTPLLPLVRQMQATDYAVVELSSFQLMDMRRSPSIAVVTNLSPNHLDVHKDMAEYVDAKKNIYLHQSADGLLILNADNAITAELSGNGITHFFSRQGAPAHIRLQEGVIYRGETPVLKTEEILLPGVHNVENYMAAIGAVEGLVPDAVIGQVARNFGGVEHRIELVRIKDGVRYYNDSIASSPSRTIAGLRSFKEKVILIAGGYDKHIPYDVLGPEICQHVKKLFLCGATAPQIRAAVEACEGQQPEMVDCGCFDNAVRAAAAAAGEGDVVLMSPASASFDEFKNFMVRGERFKQIIKEL